MDEKKQELTLEELKDVIGETIKESEIVKSVEEVKAAVEVLKSSKSVASEEEKNEKAAQFIKDLVFEKLPLEKKTITSNTGSFGYTIPTELADAIYEKKDKIAKIRANAFSFKLDGPFQLPVESTGIDAYWITTEADTDITESNPTITKKDLVDNYLAARIRVPYKLMNTSAFDIVNYVSKLASRALTSKEETAFVAGSGSGEPSGIRTASITGIPQRGDNLSYDDLVELFYSVPEQYRANGKFLASTGAIKLIRKLKDTQNLPIFNPMDQTIFVKALLECTDIPEKLGSGLNTTEIYFGDLEDYWIKDGQSLLAETRPVPGRLQADVIVYQSTDGVLVNPDSFRKLIGVK